MGKGINVPAVAETQSVQTWFTTTSYDEGDEVIKGSSIYTCLAPHTSGVFATDLDALKWVALTPEAVTSIIYSDSAIVSTAILTASVDDYDPTDLDIAILLRLSSDATWNITGMVAPSPVVARQITIFNVGANGIRFRNSSGNSLAANRFLMGGDILIQANEGIIVIYDPTDSRWRISAEHS